MERLWRRVLDGLWRSAVVRVWLPVTVSTSAVSARRIAGALLASTVVHLPVVQFQQEVTPDRLECQRRRWADRWFR